MTTVFEMAANLASEVSELRARAEAAEAEAEQLRMQLAACGVVAMSNTRESAAKAREMHPDYWCVSVADVAAAVDREMAERERAEAAEADARRWRKFMEIASNNGLGFSCPWAETDTRWEDPQTTIDAELAKEEK